jgi:hypothetical protein
MNSSSPLYVVAQEEVTGLGDIESCVPTSRIIRFDARNGLRGPSGLAAKLARIEEDMRDKRIVVFCSLDAARIIRRKHPALARGLVLNERFLHWHVYTPMLPSGVLLNEDHVLLPFGLLVRSRNLIEKTFGQQVFIRPDSPQKIFPGMVIALEDIEREVFGLQQVYNPDPADMTVVSAARDLPDFEYRFWMISGQALSPASYAFKRPHAEAPPCPEEIRTLAKGLAKHLEWIEDAVVADFVLHDGKPKLVELNAVSTSGFYPGFKLKPVLENLRNILG